MNSALQLAFSQCDKALIALEAMVNKPMQTDRSNIDACIQRFEFTIELFWKLLKRILAAHGLERTYPRDILREAYAGKLIDDEQVWLAMLNDRNLTSHTYNEALADSIYARIKTYYPLLRTTFNKLQQQT